MKFVPTNKLLFWFGLVFLPVSVLIALVPTATGPGIVLAILLVTAVIGDAVISKGRLTGIQVTTPEVVRLSVGRDGDLSLSIENEDLIVKRLRLGLAFPRELYSPYHDRLADLPAESSASRVVWPFKALKQGQFLLQNCYLETASRFGFWSLRRAQRIHSEIRVYPELLRERKRLSGLFKTWHRHSHPATGGQRAGIRTTARISARRQLRGYPLESHRQARAADYESLSN